MSKSNAIDTRRKRSDRQIEKDRTRTAELMLQGYTQREIAEKLYQETGVKLSETTIQNDIAAIRKEWTKTRQETYDEWINMELVRINTMENELWRAWRASCNDNEKEVVERVRRAFDEDEDDFDLVVRKVTTTIEKSGGVGNVAIIDRIMDAQKERRRLMGLYAPARLGIDINKKSEIIIKGYKVREVSPDAWPDVIDGEVTDVPLLEEG